MIDQITTEAAEEADNPDMLPPVGRMCELLGVSRSGWYRWRTRRVGPPGKRAARRADLAVKIRVAHDASDGVNGAPRITADLREAGEVVSCKTVARIMRDNGIRGISRDRGGQSRRSRIPPPITSRTWWSAVSIKGAQPGVDLRYHLPEDR